ncbi:MAG: DUF86 domain-containing protein [Bacteroidetes bacterium]|nr:DUF86 domain-containing protein [Bacteroidota bacterium]
MLDACEALTEFVAGRKEDDLLTDKMLLAAVSRQIEIIGEAASMLTTELRDRHPEVPWKQIVGMRHKIIHEYFAVQTDTVWDVAVNDIPTLRDQIAAIIHELPDAGF